MNSFDGPGKSVTTSTSRNKGKIGISLYSNTTNKTDEEEGCLANKQTSKPTNPILSGRYNSGSL